MITFSKRYEKDYEFKRRLPRRRLPLDSVESGDTGLFLSKELRTRLQAEIEYLIQNNYLENFLTVDDQNLEVRYLHQNSFDELGKRELGYELTDTIDAKRLTFGSGNYNDYKLFDLIEVLAVFTKDKKRNNYIERINYCLTEFGEQFILNDCTIYPNRISILSSIIAHIKDTTLKTKLISLTKDYSLYENNDSTTTAKAGADIIQYLFSSSKGKDFTKTESQALLMKVAEQFTTESKKQELAETLSEFVKSVKSLNNNINNIRHTDKHTIPIVNPNMYKFIAEINTRLAELILLSTANEHLIVTNPLEIKGQYFKRYEINPDGVWVIEKSEEILDNDLPF